MLSVAVAHRFGNFQLDAAFDSTGGLTAVLVSCNNKVMTKLLPDCYFITWFQPPYITRTLCVSYDGGRAECLCYLRNDPVRTDALRVEAAKSTTWVLAKHALPLLQG